jgi:hypothetical protein
VSGYDLLLQSLGRWHVKKILFALVFTGLIFGLTNNSAFAINYNVNRVGTFDYVHGNNGYSGTGQQIGSFYYYRDNQGNRYTVNNVGNFNYITGTNGYSATGQQTGNYYYYKDHSGFNSSTNQVGNFDYINGTNGYSARGQRVSNYYYYRDNN